MTTRTKRGGKSTLRRLGIVQSFSRPRVSHDNPFPESLFRTLNCRPEYPHREIQALHDELGAEYEYRQLRSFPGLYSS